MPLTPVVGLTLIDPGTRDPADMMNQALFEADMLLRLSAVSANLANPPAAPNPGDVYLIPPTPAASGSWSGQNGKVAAYDAEANGWRFYPPWFNMIRYVASTDTFVRWTGSSWVSVGTGGGGGSLQLSGDSSPALGGDLDGAGHTYTNLRMSQALVGDAPATGVASYRWQGQPSHLYLGTLDRDFLLPANSGVGSLFGLWVENDTPTVRFVPETGATLASGVYGRGLASVRTIGANLKIMLECKANSGGTRASWVASGSHSL